MQDAKESQNLQKRKTIIGTAPSIQANPLSTSMDKSMSKSADLSPATVATRGMMKRQSSKKIILNFGNEKLKEETSNDQSQTGENIKSSSYYLFSDSDLESY